MNVCFYIGLSLAPFPYFDFPPSKVDEVRYDIFLLVHTMTNIPVEKMNSIPSYKTYPNKYVKFYSFSWRTYF